MKFKPGKALFLSIVAATGALSSQAASGIVDGRLVVEKGEPLTLDSSYAGQVVTNLVAHDGLLVNVGENKLFNVYYPADTDGIVPPVYMAELDLAPDLGDVATLCVSNRCTLETYSTGKTAGGSSVSGMHGNLRIGRNGGLGKMVLGGMVGGECRAGNARFSTIELCAEAQVDGDATIVLNKGSALSLNSIQNSSAQPFRILVGNPNHVVPSLAGTARFRPYAKKSIFALSGTGDIVVTGAADSPIVFEAWANWGYKLIEENPKACLRFEGDGDVYVGVGSLSDVTLGYTNVVWNQSGDVHVLTLGSKDSTSKDFKSFVVDAAYALPYGPQTGNFLVYKSSGAAEDTLAVDIKGHDQYLNGLIATNNGQFVSSTGPASVTFGVGGADGVATGPLTDENITFSKAGAGTLTLANATFNALCVTGGVLRIKRGTVNHIGTLAVTNATIEIEADGSAEQLTVDNWLLDASVTVTTRLPSTGMMNEMTVATTFPAGIPVVKTGANYHTCTLPANANGVDLFVRGGTLRMGGEPCTNTFWRFVAKRAQAKSELSHGLTRGMEYSIALNDGSEVKVYVPVGLGSFGLFSADGLACRSHCNGDVTEPAGGASALKAGTSYATPGFIKGWNAGYIQKNFNVPDSTTDPILGGGTSGGSEHFVNMHNDWLAENKYDELLLDGQHRWIPNWSGGILYTNDFVQLDPAVPETWKSVTWRLEDGRPTPASYALRRIVNNTIINVTDWELLSSPTGEDGTWESMDERTDQTYGGTEFSDQYNYTYNKHVTYLFTKRSANWKFETFGTVRVDAGAVLDLSSVPIGNIAFNALEVDCASAGTITRFRPAATGVLKVVSDAASRADDGSGELKKIVTLPLKLTETADIDRLANWTVEVDGKTVSNAKVSLVDGKLQVRLRKGLFVIVR